MSDRDKPIPELRDALEERARELACLYEIGDLLKDPQADPRRVLDLVVQAIPSAWQHPETCGMRIKVGYLTFQSTGFREASHTHKADILVDGKPVGAIEVCRTQQTLRVHQGAFSPEKRKFIDTIARRVGSFLSLQHILLLSAPHHLLNREDSISSNPDSTGETGRPTSHESEHDGLCMTCVHSSACAFPRREGQPVLSCEEFDDRVEGSVETPGADNLLVRVSEARVTDVTHEPPGHTGLCATCEHRETCAYPKPEGGIWHCEEFE